VKQLTIQAIPVLLLFSCLFTQAQIQLNTAFEGANGVIDSAVSVTNTVILNSDHKGNDTKNIVFYCQITGLDPSIPLILSPQVAWAGPHMVYSYDNIHWQKIFRHDAHTFKIPLKGNSSVYVAHSYPYNYSRMMADVDSLKHHSFVQIETLCDSEGGLPVPIISISDDCVLPKSKKLIWILGRQHAFESPGSFLVEGMIDFFVSQHPEAQRLRSEAIINIVPMMDVDMVYNGGSGKDQKPVDFNRDWVSIQHKSHWNAVGAAKKRIDASAKQNPLTIFWDSHSPPPTNTEVALDYYCFKDGHYFGNLKFLRETVKTLSDFLGGVIYSSMLNTHIAEEYVIKNYGNNNTELLATTSELSFNYNPDGKVWTQASYVQSGWWHGMAISTYIHGATHKGDIVVDNTDLDDVIIDGYWECSDFYKGYFKDDYLYFIENTPKASVTFKATATATHPYEVFTRWVSNDSRASNAAVQLQYPTGTDDFTINMQLQGGAWVSLGVYDLMIGDEIQLIISNKNANGAVVADGLRLSPYYTCDTAQQPSK